MFIGLFGQRYQIIRTVIDSSNYFAKAAAVPDQSVRSVVLYLLWVNDVKNETAEFSGIIPAA
ncbi:hypothetical protein O71_09344 [Pontibacter sp. BAB1700]|nr:hypothetical protein O71_09344 [Pontibacter sp. BAB1700]